ncbi:MAG: class I SAM-dependent RNA methyltransferase [Treponemataceae bacterium]|nr:class I SAM-dependent RNA methyltransferase [Treponemataceae bacterium]
MITLVALCAIGAEKVLAQEIKHLDYTPCGNAPGRVAFTAPNQDALFRANLCLRTADRVYIQLASFYAEDFDQLFDGISAIDWQDFFYKDVRVVVDKVRSNKSKLSSEHSVQKIVHKAIYTKLGQIWRMSVLPESGAESSVRIYIDQNQVLVLLDLSGEPLNKRGYRTAGGEAPIRETLAATLLQLMCWRRKTPLHDPFCGSGTIAIEAALYAYNIAPGFGRHFALENLSIYDQARCLEIKKEEAAKIRPDATARITGTDINPEAVARAKMNAEHACVSAGRALQLIGSDMRIQRPDFVTADFKILAAPYPEGMILANPPYGERLGNEQEAQELYHDMAELFESFPNWQMGFITSHPGFERALGRHATKTKRVKCGNLETVFYSFL